MSEYSIFRTNLVGGQDFVIANDGSTWIPMDPANSDYQQYLKWVAEGNEPSEWTMPDAPQ